MLERRCENCRHWNHCDGVTVALVGHMPANDADQLGECRAYPPLAFSPTHTGFWPLVARNEWCGVFQPKGE